MTTPDYTQVATLTFEDELYWHGSWGSKDAGKYESTMDLYLRTDNTGFIEWDIPEMEHCEEIGLVFEIGVDGTRTLCDYAGIMALPVQACQLMRSAGIVVPDEFDDSIDKGD